MRFYPVDDTSNTNTFDLAENGQADESSYETTTPSGLNAGLIFDQTTIDTISETINQTFSQVQQVTENVLERSKYSTTDLLERITTTSPAITESLPETDLNRQNDKKSIQALNFTEQIINSNVLASLQTSLPAPIQTVVIASQTAFKKITAEPDIQQDSNTAIEAVHLAAATTVQNAPAASEPDTKSKHLSALATLPFNSISLVTTLMTSPVIADKLSDVKTPEVSRPTTMNENTHNLEPMAPISSLVTPLINALSEFQTIARNTYDTLAIPRKEFAGIPEKLSLVGVNEYKVIEPSTNTNQNGRLIDIATIQLGANVDQSTSLNSSPPARIISDNSLPSKFGSAMNAALELTNPFVEISATSKDLTKQSQFFRDLAVGTSMHSGNESNESTIQLAAGKFLLADINSKSYTPKDDNDEQHNVPRLLPARDTIPRQEQASAFSALIPQNFTAIFARSTVNEGTPPVKSSSTLSTASTISATVPPIKLDKPLNSTQIFIRSTTIDELPATKSANSLNSTPVFIRSTTIEGLSATKSTNSLSSMPAMMMPLPVPNENNKGQIQKPAVQDTGSNSSATVFTPANVRQVFFPILTQQTLTERVSNDRPSISLGIPASISKEVIVRTTDLTGQPVRSSTTESGNAPQVVRDIKDGMPASKNLQNPDPVGRKIDSRSLSTPDYAIKQNNQGTDSARIPTSECSNIRAEMSPAELSAWLRAKRLPSSRYMLAELSLSGIALSLVLSAGGVRRLLPKEQTKENDKNKVSIGRYLINQPIAAKKKLNDLRKVILTSGKLQPAFTNTVPGEFLQFDDPFQPLAARPGSGSMNSNESGDKKDRQPKPVCTRPVWLINTGETLTSIAEDHFHDPNIAWLIADLNKAVSKEYWLDEAGKRKRIVEFDSRQTLTLPVWQDIVDFYNTVSIDANLDDLITIVKETQLDRQIVNDALGAVIGTKS